MADRNIYDEIIKHLDRKIPIQEEVLASFFDMHLHELHLMIKDINLEQVVIIKTAKGYLLNNEFHSSKRKSWRRIKTAVLYADYENTEHYTYDKLKQFEKDIVITGVYHLYQPISSSRTEFIINASGYRPPMLVPQVMISSQLNEEDIQLIKATIQDIKKQTF